MPRTILLLARAAIAGPALADMAALAEAVAVTLGGVEVDFAFTEQGQPSLRDRLTALAGRESVVLVPLMLPAEPGQLNSLARMVDRWRARQAGPVPRITLTPAPSALRDDLAGLIARLLAEEHTDLTARRRPPPDASVIPDARRRVLVCMGGPCSDAGAAGLWQHLRARQDREKLRTAHAGMMSCRTSCLGPCNLAPVMQVWPEGTYYCGVDEAALDRIIDGHVIGAEPVEALAYRPIGAKQRLR